MSAALLAGGDRVTAPVAVVVAHPDDETLWAGALLGRLAQARLIHLTDGAPRDMADATRLGIATRAAYAAIRAAELDAALAALGAAPARIGYDVTDQETIAALPALVDRLTRDLAGVAIVATHPFEGGHPDHDTAALAVRRAVERLGADAPAVVEFASYHAVGGERRFGAFWPDADHPEQVRPLTAPERERIDRAIRAHASQAGVIGDWRPAVERWRAAPRYDFTQPAPPGESLYDGFGWTLTSERWRAQVTEPAC